MEITKKNFPTSSGCASCQKKGEAKERAATLTASVEQSADLPKAAPRYVREPELSREADAHNRRGGRPYSIGHRRMYAAPLNILRGEPNLKILEIGTGIGYGLERMLEAGFVAEYHGIEPNADSFEMARLASQRFPQQNVNLHNTDWLSLMRENPDAIPVCDYSFCIEVIEHIPAVDVPEFLNLLRVRTLHNLFLSTPCAATSNHGVATKEEWARVLRHAGFHVATIARQWTTMSICEVR